MKEYELNIGELSKKAVNLLKDSAMLTIPLNKRKKILMQRLKPYLSQKELNLISRRIKQKKVEVKVMRKGFSFLVSSRDVIPRIYSTDEQILELNSKIEEKFWNEAFLDFSQRAWHAIPEYIAPNTLGMKYIKQAIALMLAADNISILLLSNPSISKTEFLRNAEELTKDAVAYSELKKLDKKQRFFVTVPNIEKKAKILDNYLNYTHSKILGYANFGKEFYTRPKDLIKEAGLKPGFAYQFNLIFHLKPIDIAQFEDLAESIVKAKKVEINPKDVLFIRKYLNTISKLPVSIPDALEEEIRQFSIYLKENEEQLPIPINEQTIRTLTELVRASARLDRRKKADEKDLDRVFSIFKNCLKI